AYLLFKSETQSCKITQKLLNNIFTENFGMHLSHKELDSITQYGHFLIDNFRFSPLNIANNASSGKIHLSHQRRYTGGTDSNGFAYGRTHNTTTDKVCDVQINMIAPIGDRLVDHFEVEVVDVSVLLQKRNHLRVSLNNNVARWVF